MSWPAELVPLKKVDLETGQIEDLPDTVGMWGAMWSPNGKYIASHLSGSLKLSLFDRGAKNWVTLEDFEGEHFTWSKDSNSLYHVNSSTLYRLLLEDQIVEEVAIMDFRGLNENFRWYCFSPNGELLAPRDLSDTELYSLDFKRH